MLAVTTVTTGQLEPTTGWSHQHQALRIAPKLSCLCQKEVASTARQCCTATRTSHTTQPELHCSSLAVAPFHSMAVWCCNPLQPIKRCKTAAIRHSAACRLKNNKAAFVAEVQLPCNKHRCASPPCLPSHNTAHTAVQRCVLTQMQHTATVLSCLVL